MVRPNAVTGGVTPILIDEPVPVAAEDITNCVLLVMLLTVAPEGMLVPPTFQPIPIFVVVPVVNVTVVEAFVVDPTNTGLSTKFISVR